MSDEDKTKREHRKAILFDGVVGLLAIAIFLQVSVPAVIPLVEAWKKPTPAVKAAVPAKHTK